MKNFLILTSTVLVAVGLTACSSTNKDVKVVSDEVIDAGMHSADPVKIKSSDVIDGGIYHDSEANTDLGFHGGQIGMAPTQLFYTVDREKFVSVGKMLYVLTDDSPARCIKARYAQVEGRKKLVVYSKSTVPSNYCIYQKTFSIDAEGFSIFINHGGICKPSFTNISTDNQKRKLASIEPVNNMVSMAYCTQSTISYGEELLNH